MTRASKQNSRRANIRRGNLADPADAQALVTLLEAYLKDPKGAAVSGERVDINVAEKLRAYPHVMVFFAELCDEIVGMAVCFTGFSTFKARELLNVHDLIVLPEYRHKGIGRELMSAVEAHAKLNDCCKITLEVREDNPIAQQLYHRLGFGDEMVPMRFWVKYL